MSAYSLGYNFLFNSLVRPCSHPVPLSLCSWCVCAKCELVVFSHSLLLMHLFLFVCIFARLSIRVCRPAQHILYQILCMFFFFWHVLYTNTTDYRDTFHFMLFVRRFNNRKRKSFFFFAIVHFTQLNAGILFLYILHFIFRRTDSSILLLLLGSTWAATQFIAAFSRRTYTQYDTCYHCSIVFLHRNLYI